MSPPFFWSSTSRDYVQVVGVHEGPRQWSVEVVDCAGRSWRTHPHYLRAYNTAARQLLASLLAEVEDGPFACDVEAEKAGIA